jgi:hypothetical protein
VTGQPTLSPSARAVDVADDTYLACPPELVAPLLGDPLRWAGWWPDLRLTTTRDRGLKGRQWAVAGRLTGTAEIWLEPWWDGVVLHFYLRADPPGDSAGGAGGRAGDRERARRAQQWKTHVHRLKDELERGRRPGEPSVAWEGGPRE